MRTRDRNQMLDVVRMLAALAVVLHHARNPMALDLGPLAPDLGLAVFVFFSLSGFLVSTPFLSADVPTGPYLVRRLMRIFPAYVVAVMVALAIRDPASYPAGRELEFLFMFQSLDPMHVATALAVAWTLYIEVMFYLFLPVLAVAFRRWTGTNASRQAGVVLVLGVLSFVGFFLDSPMVVSSTARIFLAPLLFWAFVPGMLIAWAVLRTPMIARRLAQPGWFAVAALLTISPIIHAPGGADRPWNALAVSVGSAMLIPGLSSARSIVRPVAVLGAAGRTLSYATYLWHIPIILIVAGLGITGWAGVGVATVVVLAIAATSWFAVERPANACAAWLIARLGSPPAPSPAALPALAKDVA